MSWEVVLSKASKKAVTLMIREMIKRAEKIRKCITEDFKIEGEEFSISCPDSVQKHTISFRINKNLTRRKIKFTGPIRNVTLKSIVPLKDMSQAAIRYTNDGFEILYDPLKSGDIYILDIEYIIDSKLIDDLVKRNSSLETSNETTREYWMHAELKHLDIFRMTYKNINISDLDLGVDVSIHQDITTSIPPAFKQELETVIRWIRSTDRGEKHELSLAHLRQKRSRQLPRNVDFLDTIKELQEIFLEKQFRSFIEVSKDFTYHTTIRGVEIYNVPFPTWPRFMRVISRTNLNYDKPAAEGILRYNHYNLKRKVEEIFNGE